MRLSILLFDGFTALDAVGGFEVLVQVPNVEVEFVAKDKGVIANDSRRLGLAAYKSLDEVESTGILYVPGGPGVVTALKDTQLLETIRRLDGSSTWTVGICSGVALLAAAGILKGKSVTTNWSWRDRVSAYGTDVVKSRYHRDGKFVTSAGVSASIDAAFYLARALAGDTVARTIQIGLEYFPEPPFGPGSVDEAPQSLKDAVLYWEKNVGVKTLLKRPPF